MSTPPKMARLQPYFNHHTINLATTTPELDIVPMEELKKWGLFSPVNEGLLSRVTVANVIAMGSRSSGVFVTKEDNVYSVGSDLFGCLGTGNSHITHGHYSSAAVRVDELCGKKVIGLYSGPGLPSSWFAVTADGRLYGWGDNEGGVLGRGFSSPFISVPNRILLAPGSHVVQVASGSNQTLALTQCGQVFSWGVLGGGNRPKNITATIHPTAKFVYIATGEEHAAAISNLGRLFVWGANRHGQLGGESVSNLPSPITKVVCSSGYTMALTKSGELYTWGKNSQGQLGIGNISPMVEQPTQIDMNDRVVDIAASRFSGISVCRTRGGIFCWGNCDGTGSVPVCAPRAVISFESIHQLFASYNPEMMHEALTAASCSVATNNNPSHQTVADTLLSVFLSQSCETLDVTFMVEGKKVSAHKNILQMRSAYFQKMFEKTNWTEGQSSVIPINGDVKYKIFFALLYYLYSDRIQFALDDYTNIIELFYFADFCCEDYLTKKCEKLLIRSINLENVLEFHCAASRGAKQDNLERATFDFMVENWPELVSSGKLHDSEITRDDLLKLSKAVAEKYF